MNLDREYYALSEKDNPSFVFFESINLLEFQAKRYAKRLLNSDWKTLERQGFRIIKVKLMEVK